MIALLFGYAFGSIPFGLIITKLAGEGDVRDIGSGNIGATNVLRTGKKSLAALTLVMDMVKGALPVIIAENYAPGLGIYGGMGAFLGHLYPIWLRFKGGKGVATLLGVVAALSWPFALIFAAVWLAGLAVFRFSSLSGILASAAMPISAIGFERMDLLPVTIGFLVFILWKHRPNLQRLFSGSEPKVGAKKD